jgi:hypothetical protein
MSYIKWDPAHNEGKMHSNPGWKKSRTDLPDGHPPHNHWRVTPDGKSITDGVTTKPWTARGIPEVVEPEIGMFCWIWGTDANPSRPIPGIIMIAHDTRGVGVAGIYRDGSPFQLHDIPLLQEDDPHMVGTVYASWRSRVMVRDEQFCREFDALHKWYEDDTKPDTPLDRPLPEHFPPRDSAPLM